MIKKGAMIAYDGNVKFERAAKVHLNRGCVFLTHPLTLKVL